eukprot:gene28665-37647_t
MGNSHLQIGLFLVSAIAVSVGALQLAKFIAEENNFRFTIGPLALDLTAICRIIWTSAFALNLVTVSLPGRFDSISAEEAQKKKLNAISEDDAKQIEVTMPWTTFFEPSPWAFAIWGVIYLTELLLTGFVFCLGNIQRSVVESATACWVAGNAFQSIWCLCFRPEYRQSLWLPMMFLGLSSFSFFKAHQEITLLIGSSSASLHSLQKLGLYLFRFPFSLHATWLAAATLLNLNAWAAVQRLPTSWQADAAYLSGLLAFLVSAGVTAWSGDPFVALTAAWALTAVKGRTRNKEISTTTDSKLKKLYSGLANFESMLVSMLFVVAAAVPVWHLLKE